MSLVVLAIENRRWCRRSYVHNCDFWSNLSRVGLEGRREPRGGGGSDSGNWIANWSRGNSHARGISTWKLLTKEFHCDRRAEISKRNVEACQFTKYDTVLTSSIPILGITLYWLKLSVETIAFRSWLREGGRRLFGETLEKCNSISKSRAVAFSSSCLYVIQ